MDIESLGDVWQAGARLYVRCAKPHRDGLKSVRACGNRHEVDVQTLVWTRGKTFPISMLSSRMKWLPAAHGKSLSRSRCLAASWRLPRRPARCKRRCHVNSHSVFDKLSRWLREGAALRQRDHASTGEAKVSDHARFGDRVARDLIFGWSPIRRPLSCRRCDP